MEQFSLLLTGDWQKDFCTNKVVRKIHTESGGKGREAIRLGLVPPRRDTEEERSSLGSEWFQPHIGLPDPGSDMGNKSVWLVGGPVGLTGGLWGA